jgi:hypothetical protein
MAFSIDLDTSVLDRIEAGLPGMADNAVGKIATDTQAYMQSHMSAESPAPVGSAPGMRSGNLMNTIQAQPDAPGKWSVWGPGYGLLLEFGTVKMGARPFILNATLAVAKTVPDVFRAEAGLFY